MNLLFYSDLHIRPESAQVCDHVLGYILKVAKILEKKHGKVTIVNCGDTFNTRGEIRTHCFDIVQKHWRKWSDEKFYQYVLVGNHDQEDRDGKIHPLKVFDNDWIHVIDEPYVIDYEEKIALFPYMKLEKIADAINENPAQFAVVHWGIQGAKRNDFNVDTDGVPLDWLRNYQKVFSGHYHFRNSVENVTYVGSPYQQNFGEMGQEKGLLFFTRGKTSFIKIPNTPKHYEARVSFDAGARQIERDSNITDKDYVRVKVQGTINDVSSFRKEDLDFGAASIKLEREIKDTFKSRLKIDSTTKFSIKDLMKKYVDHVGFDEKRIDKLMEVGEQFL